MDGPAAHESAVVATLLACETRMLHQTLARRICRGVFLAGCVLPTLAVLIAAVWWNLPAARQRHFGQLAQLLDVRIDARSYTTPLPGQTRLREATLSDMETGQPLIALARLDARRDGNRLELVIQEVDAAGNALDWIGRLATRLLASDWPSETRVEIRGGSFGQADVVDARLHLRSIRTNGDITARRLAIELAATDGGRLECNVVRSREADSPRTEVSVEASQFPLDGDLLNVIFGGSWQRAPNARFSGKVQLVFADGQSSGEVQGEFADIEKDDSPEGQFAARDLRLSFDKLRFRNGRIVSAAGSVDADGGAMSAELARRLVSHLHLRPAVVIGDGSVEFDRIGVRFVLDAKGLTLWGDRPGMPSGAIVALADQPLLAEPASIEIPTRFLAWFVSPAPADVIPASDAALELARRLPLPGDGGQR